VKLVAFLAVWASISIFFFYGFGLTVGTAFYVLFWVSVVLLEVRQDKYCRELSKLPFPTDIRKQLYGEGSYYVYWARILPPELREYQSRMRWTGLTYIFLFVLILFIISTGI